MRNYPTDEYDQKELARLNCEPWQVELLKLNPGYCSWGPHEDYMWKEGSGWDSRVIVENWKAFNFELDDLNECVNFYFQLNRESKDCPVCNGNGCHPDAQWISESFYGHSTPFRRQNARELESIAVLASFGGEGPKRAVSGFPSGEVLERYGREFRDFCEEMRSGGGEWHHKITDDEYEALKASNRHRKAKSASEVNAIERAGGMDGHDAINRGILIEARCKRLGVPHYCEECEGHASVFTEPKAHVTLVLWMLHPRKGCSRGVEVTRIEESELPAVRAYLRKAADRNAERFSRIHP